MAVVFAPVMLWAGEGKIRKRPHGLKGEYIVVLEDDTPAEDVPWLARRLARQYGGTLKQTWQYALKGFFVHMSEGQAQGLSHHPDVKFIEENAEVFLSATVPTNVDPACDPSPGVTCTTTDNRMWHLDILDQNADAGTQDYSYCETGSGVTVYVVDTGVMRNHREFNNDSSKVKDGYDATGDPAYYAAHNPCGSPPLDGLTFPDAAMNPGAVLLGRSHGTAVGSLVAGLHVGVAREATIVPVKVAPCAKVAARKFNFGTTNTSYATGEVVYAFIGNASFDYYTISQGGTTGASNYPETGWPTAQSLPSAYQEWGGVRLQYLGADALPAQQTLATMTRGIDWILGPNNPNPKSPAVVTMSVWDVVNSDTQADVTTLETAIAALLTYGVNKKGITVVASANNQDANACDTSPARMSRGNPLNPWDPNKPWSVITAGGTMLRNNPDANPATGGTKVNLAEPLHDPSEATRVARWRCHAGDSTNCIANIKTVYETAPQTIPDPTDPADRDDYIEWTLGSNGGQCVTLFAPAKNIPVANLGSYDAYRNPRTTGGLASGTSWSAPIVAGMAARILQNNQNYNIDQVHQALMSRTTPDLDEEERNPPGVTGTPPYVLRMTPVVVQPLESVTPLDANGDAAIFVSASGAPNLSYQLYQVNPLFDVTEFARGDAAATAVGSPQSSNAFVVSPSNETSYFVRVRSSCGSADTNITTVKSTIVPVPTGVIATANAGTVTISWNAVANATGYQIERKIGTGAWTAIQTVAVTQANDTPSVPASVVLYRVRAMQGSALSDPSDNDVAYAGTFTDDPILTAAPFTKIKAIHLIEVRRAVNALRELGGSGPLYGSNDLDEAYVRTLAVDDAHFTTSRVNLNDARAAVGLPPIDFQVTPGSGAPIDDTQMSNLRSGVK